MHDHETTTQQDENLDVSVLEEKDKKLDALLEKITKYELPPYLLDVYRWCYINPKMVDFLDKPLTYHLLLLGQGNRLTRAYLKGFENKDKVLQLGNVYGNLIVKLAEKIGSKGKLDVMDAIPYQIEKIEEKLSKYKHCSTILQDASAIWHRDYNKIGLFFLLHEVPSYAKGRILRQAFKQIDENNAKITIIDYHNPHALSPLRGILSVINVFLEPFANELWEYDIWELVSKSENYNWEKTTYFAGTYQKVVISKKT